MGAVWLDSSHLLVFIDPCSLALGAEYEILVSHGRVHVTDIVQYCLTLRTHFLVAASWGDQGSCELALRTGCVCHVFHEA